MGRLSDWILSIIEGIAIKIKVWAWHRRVNRRFIKLYKQKKKMIDKIFYSMFGFVDSCFLWIDKQITKRKKKRKK